MEALPGPELAREILAPVDRESMGGVPSISGTPWALRYESFGAARPASMTLSH